MTLTFQRKSHSFSKDKRVYFFAHRIGFTKPFTQWGCQIQNVSEVAAIKMHTDSLLDTVGQPYKRFKTKKEAVEYVNKLFETAKLPPIVDNYSYKTGYECKEYPQLNIIKTKEKWQILLLDSATTSLEELIDEEIVFDTKKEACNYLEQMLSLYKK